MNDAKVRTKQVAGSTEHSASYQEIRNNAASKWPAWKVTVYNTSVATSNHAKKVKK